MMDRRRHLIRCQFPELLSRPSASDEDRISHSLATDICLATSFAATAGQVGYLYVTQSKDML